MRVSVCARDYIGRGAPLPPSARPSGSGGLAHRWRDAFDDGAAETALALVGDRVLTGLDGALRLIERRACAAVRSRFEQRRLIGLAVAHLHAAAERFAARGAEPMPRSGGEGAACQQRMIVSLHDDERVAGAVFRRHIPGLLGVPVPSAQLEPAALAERIERKSLMGPEPLPGGRFDGPGGAREEARQKLAERALADEADTGAVGLVEYRQPGAARALAHRAFVQLAERHQRARQRLARDGVQEIALILGGIARLVEPRAPGSLLQPRVVPGREVRCAQAPRPLKRYAELDLAVAQHVRIGCAARAVLAQKMPEHALAILEREAGAMQGNAELGRDRARVLEVPGAGAIRVVVLLPVAHEQALHL